MPTCGLGTSRRGIQITRFRGGMRFPRRGDGRMEGERGRRVCSLRSSYEAGSRKDLAGSSDSGSPSQTQTSRSELGLPGGSSPISGPDSGCHGVPSPPMKDSNPVPWPDSVRRVAFLFAMSAEGLGFAEALGLEDRGRLDPDLASHWFEGRFSPVGDDRPESEIEIAVAFAGTDPTHGVDQIGTVPATLTAYKLLRRFKPDLLVNAGTCGGFHARGGRVGSLYLGAKAFLFHDRRIPLPGFDAFGLGRIPADHPKALLGLLNAEPGVVSTGDSFTPTEAELAFFETEGVHVKDMEAAAVARLAASLQVPFLAVKAVTDLVDRPEPEEESFLRNLERVSAMLQERLHRMLGWF